MATITSSGEAGLGETVYVGLQLAILLGVAPFTLRGIYTADQRLMRWAAGAFVVGQSVSGLAGIAQVFGASPLGEAAANGRSPGLAGHPNVLGVMAVIAILVCVASIIRGYANRAFCFALLAVNVAGLLATGSLSSMSAGAFGVLVLLYAAGYRVLRIAFVAAIVVGFAIWFLGIPEVALALRNPLDRFYQVTGQTEAISTLDIRAQTYDAAIAGIARDPLLGKGLSAESAASISSGTVVHNVLLRAWYQGGLVFGLAIGLIIAAALLVTVQAIVRRQNGLAASVMIAMLSFGMTSAFFEQAYYWLPVLAAWASLPRRTRDRAGST
ncbi:O-antigen ligase [Microbacterium sp. C7(2022)]|uniref:O-antigen ligase family protein n=1 Tax=Microbacterium sp. C7(2022) TaxID=2992759 RepID=UPI00237BBEF4|nr:hypothetical protein [Microbacterium sp. C7(2022)]MDE0545395.1 hypothetical protein [Microbacterium sp. C7(2022)]